MYLWCWKGQVWALVDIDRRGALGREAFYCALRLIAQARHAQQQTSSAAPHLHPQRPLSLEAAASPNAPRTNILAALHLQQAALLIIFKTIAEFSLGPIEQSDVNSPPTLLQAWLLLG